MEQKIREIQNLLIKLEDNSLRPGVQLPEGVTFKSDLTVAHLARIEISNLTDIEYIGVFQKLLSTETNTKNKINLIHNLIKLADINEINEIADYVLALVKKEKTRWVNDVSLKSLYESKLIIEKETEILFELSAHKDWQIRNYSIKLLSRLPASFHDRIEQLCFSLIEKFKADSYTIISICYTLYFVGSLDSISFLKSIIKNTNKSEVISSSLSAINKLNGKNELDYFIETFNVAKETFLKRYLISLISKHGGTEQTEIMIERIKTILSSDRKTNMAYLEGSNPEIITILMFLELHNYQEFLRTINWIVTKKTDKLDATESSWINNKIKGII